MNFTTNQFNTSFLNNEANNQIMIGKITKQQYLQSLVDSALESYSADLLVDVKDELVASAIEANNMLFEEQLTSLNSAEQQERFKVLRNLFVINQQDIYATEDEKIGFVTYHYLENELLLDAVKSFTEIAKLEGKEIVILDNVYYTDCGIIDLNTLTLTVCMPKEMLNYVSEVGVTNFKNNIERLKDFPELKASVEALYN